MGVCDLQSAVNSALAITASVAGDKFDRFHPLGVTAPIVQANWFGSVKAWVTADPTLKTAKQSVEGKPDWYAAIDPGTVLPGDYLVGCVYGTPATFFVQAIERLNAPHLIRCNRTVTITRMQANVSPGLQESYGGDVSADATAVITGWPASVLTIGSKGAPNAMQLPNDTKLGSVTVLLPPSVPVPIFANDTLTDELGNRYGISAAELSPLGWRLNADQWKQG